MMSPHPLSESYLKSTGGIVVAVIAATILSYLLAFYSAADISTSIVISSLYIFLLSIAGYICWNLLSYLKTFFSEIFLLVVVQLLCIAGMVATLFVAEPYSPVILKGVIPLCLAFGSLCFIILIQWYRAIICKELMQQMEDNMRNEIPKSEKVEVLDKISVKEGSQIHIVRLEELLYIQAYGDYVLLYTNKGRFLKEQTMKFFENHLPMSFIRIHRSCIVNSEMIARVELFGKESYNVYLNNGVTLKASTTGYRLLKEKLYL